MTITEVSRKYGLSADTLRYYEKIGLIPAVTRNQSGIRDYTESDLGWVEFTKCMRGAGVQVEALAEYVALFRQGDKTREARRQILIEQRGQLAAKVSELQKILERLDLKIERYDHELRRAEEKLMGTVD